MPLDPIVKALLDAVAAMDLPGFSSMTPQDARTQYKASRQTGAAEPVALVEDRTIPGPAGEIPVRAYHPKPGETLAGLVFYHGGGWVIGDLDTHDAVCRVLANRANCAVVSVDYRLAPEHKFPAAADDAYAAASFVQANAASFGIDAARVAVGGDSAGGNLTATTALMARDRGGPPLVFQLMIYPVTDHSYEQASYVDNAEGYFLTTGVMKWFGSHYLRDEKDARDPYAAPLHAPDLRGLPPALVITAEFDPLRDEGEQYAKRLRAAGVPCSVHRYDGMVHGFVSMFELVRQGREALEESASALQAAFEKTAAGASGSPV